jgi:hypothetical protein
MAAYWKRKWRGATAQGQPGFHRMATPAKDECFMIRQQKT